MLFIQKIKDFPRNFICGIENLIKWFPVIWKDRQWDHTFIYRILRHKLHLTEQFIRHNGIHANNVKDADRMKICVLLLDRLINDIHFEMAFKAFHKKWGYSDWKFEKDENNKGSSRLIFEYSTVKTKEDKMLHRKEFKRACDYEDFLKERDLEYLFSTMRKYIQGWWD
jgi:hypothetical protein